MIKAGFIVFAFFIACIAGVISGCDALLTIPSDSNEAALRIKQSVILPVNPQTGEIGFLDMSPNSTKIIPAARPCEGAVGSVLPPVLDACPVGFTDAVLVPLFTPVLMLAKVVDDGLKKILGDIFVESDSISNSREVLLANAEGVWVPQGSDDCWAAALESARAFLHLHHITRQEIVELLKGACPSIAASASGSADAYQIVYTIMILQHNFDGDKVRPHFCSSVECIIAAIDRQRPVIMLKNEHALLVTGISYYPPGAFANNPIASKIHITVGGKSISETNIPLIRYIYVLDPSAENAKAKKLFAHEVCVADAFVVL